MKQFKKFVSLSLALLLVISFFPNIAYADGEGISDEAKQEVIEVVESTETIENAAQGEELGEKPIEELENSEKLIKEEAELEDEPEVEVTEVQDKSEGETTEFQNVEDNEDPKLENVEKRNSLNSSTINADNVDEYLKIDLDTDEDINLNDEANGYDDYVLDVNIELENLGDFFDDDFAYVDEVTLVIELPEEGLKLAYGQDKEVKIPWIGAFEEKRFWDVDIDVSKVEREYSYDVVVYIGDGDSSTNDDKVEIKRFTRTIKVPAVQKKRGIIFLHGITGGEIKINQNSNSSVALANMTEDLSYSHNRPYKSGDILYVSDAANVDSYIGMFTSLFGVEYIKTDMLMMQCDRYGNPIVASGGTGLLVEGEHYGPIGIYNPTMKNLVDNFKDDYGTRNINFFGYDWRLSSSKSANNLEAAIEEEGYDEVILISHSMGGLVVSSFLKKEENREKVDKYISIATPFLGAPKVVMVLGTGGGMTGYDLADQVVGSMLRYLTVNMPAIYELLPNERYFSLNKSYYLNTTVGADSNTRAKLETFDESINIVNEMFDKGNDRVILENALDFHEGLFEGEKHISSLVNTYYIVGYGYDTIAELDIDHDEDGNYDWMYESSHRNIEGDGTVPLISALVGGKLGNAKKYFANKEHLAIVSDESVLALIDSIIASKSDEDISYSSDITEDLLSVIGNRPLTPKEDGITYEELANNGIDFSIEKVEVSFELSGLEEVDNIIYEKQRLIKGNKAVRPEIVEVKGYDFEMFTLDGEQEFNFEESEINEDIVIKAVYKKTVNEEIEALDAEPITTFVTVALDEETQADFDALSSFGFKWMHVAFKESISGLGYYEMGMNYDITNSHGLKAGNIASVDLGKGVWYGAQIVVPVEGNKEFNPIKMSIKSVRRGYWFPTTYRTLFLNVSKRFDVSLESLKEHNFVDEDVLIKVIDDENNYFVKGLKAVYLDDAQTPLNRNDYDIEGNLIILRSNLFSETGNHRIRVRSKNYDDRVLEFEVERELEEFVIKTGENYVGSPITFVMEGSEGDFLSNLTELHLDESIVDSSLYSISEDMKSITLDASLFSQDGQKTLKFIAKYYGEVLFNFDVLPLKDVKIIKIEKKSYSPWFGSPYDYYELSFDDDDYASLVNYVKVRELEYQKSDLSEDDQYMVYSSKLIDIRFAGFAGTNVTDTNAKVLMKADGYNDLEFVVDRNGEILDVSQTSILPEDFEIAYDGEGVIFLGNPVNISTQTLKYIKNIHKIEVDGELISSDKYSVENDILSIDYEVFGSLGEHEISVYANSYDKKNFTVNYVEESTEPELIAPPETDTIGIQDGWWVDSYDFKLKGEVDFADYFKKVKSISVNGVELEKSSSYSSLSQSGEYFCKDKLIGIGKDEFEEGESVVLVKADGYEDFKFTVSRESYWKNITYVEVEELVEEEVPVDVPEDGDENTESSETETQTENTGSTEAETETEDAETQTESAEETEIPEEETENAEEIILNPFKMEKYELKSGTLSYYCRISFEHDSENQADDLAEYLSKIKSFEVNGTVYSSSLFGNLTSDNMYTVSEGKYIDFSIGNVNFDASNLVMVEAEGYKNNYILLAKNNSETLKVLPKVKSVSVRLIPTLMDPGYARLEFEGEPEQVAQFIYNIESVNVNGYEYNKYPVVGSGILFKLLEISEDVGLRDVAVKFSKYIAENMGANPLASDLLSLLNDNVEDLSGTLSGFIADHSWFGAEREKVQNANGEWIKNETTVTEILDLKTAILPSPLGTWAYLDFSSESIDFFGPTNIVIKSEGFEDLSVDFTVVSTILDQGQVKDALAIKDVSFHDVSFFPDYCRFAFDSDSKLAVNNYLLSIRSIKVNGIEHSKHSSLLWSNSFMFSKVYGDIFGKYAFLDMTTGAFPEEGSVNVEIFANGYKTQRFALDKQGNISEFNKNVPDKDVEFKILEVKEGDDVVQSAPETE